jgi:hypothetical protein
MVRSTRRVLGSADVRVVLEEAGDVGLGVGVAVLHGPVGVEGLLLGGVEADCGAGVEAIGFAGDGGEGVGDGVGGGVEGGVELGGGVNQTMLSKLAGRSFSRGVILTL